MPSPQGRYVKPIRYDGPHFTIKEISPAEQRLADWLVEQDGRAITRGLRAPEDVPAGTAVKIRVLGLQWTATVGVDRWIEISSGW